MRIVVVLNFVRKYVVDILLCFDASFDEFGGMWLTKCLGSAFSPGTYLYG